MDIIRSNIVVFIDYVSKIPHLWRGIVKAAITIAVSSIPVFAMIATAPLLRENMLLWALLVFAMVPVYVALLLTFIVAYDFADWSKFTKKPCTSASFKEYLDLRKKCNIGLFNPALFQRDMTTYELVLRKKVKKAMEKM